MLSPEIVLLGSQLFKGKLRFSANKLLLAIHDNLLNISVVCHGWVCRISWFRNCDHPLFPKMGEDTSFMTVYWNGSGRKGSNRWRHWLYLHVRPFISSCRCCSRKLWTLRRQKRNTNNHLSEKNPSSRWLQKTIWRHLRGLWIIK